MLRLLAILGFLTAGVSHLPGAPSEETPTVTIKDSGSTNRPGFVIVVDQEGNAELTSRPRNLGAKEAQPVSIRRMLPHALVEAFYLDIKAAKPFASLPAAHCAKSVSFGSVMTVAFGQEQTPDLNCGDGGNAVMHDLIRDTKQIVALVRAD